MFQEMFQKLGKNETLGKEGKEMTPNVKKTKKRCELCGRKVNTLTYYNGFYLCRRCYCEETTPLKAIDEELKFLKRYRKLPKILQNQKNTETFK